MFDALGSGNIDLYLLRPEQPRDEEFHRAITESLEDWALTRGGGFEAVRIIGDPSIDAATSFATASAAITSPSASTTRRSRVGRQMIDDLGLDRPAAAGRGAAVHAGTDGAHGADATSKSPTRSG